MLFWPNWYLERLHMILCFAYGGQRSTVRLVVSFTTLPVAQLMARWLCFTLLSVCTRTVWAPCSSEQEDQVFFQSLNSTWTGSSFCQWQIVSSWQYHNTNARKPLLSDVGIINSWTCLLKVAFSGRLAFTDIISWIGFGTILTGRSVVRPWRVQTFFELFSFGNSCKHSMQNSQFHLFFLFLPTANRLRVA